MFSFKTLPGLYSPINLLIFPKPKLSFASFCIIEWLNMKDATFPDIQHHI